MEQQIKRILQGIAVILFSIVLILVYGQDCVFDLSLRWGTIFVILGACGLLAVFWQDLTAWRRSRKEKKKNGEDRW